MKTLRTFLAIPLPENIIRAIDNVRSELAPVLPGVRWVAPEAMHLTLKFFGDISYSDIDKIKTSMELLQKKTAAFATDIAGLGAFPALFRARVVWLGVANQSACRELHSAVERTLSRAGFERDKRPFAPHLTLGRFKKPLPSAHELLEKYRHVYCGKMMADRLVLFESRLHPRGAIHSPLFSISLGGTDSEDREVD